MLQFAVDENSKDVYGKQEGSNPLLLRLPGASVCCCSGQGNSSSSRCYPCVLPAEGQSGVLTCIPVRTHLHFRGSRAFFLGFEKKLKCFSLESVSSENLWQS